MNIPIISKNVATLFILRWEFKISQEHSLLIQANPDGLKITTTLGVKYLSDDIYSNYQGNPYNAMWSSGESPVVPGDWYLYLIVSDNGHFTNINDFTALELDDIIIIGPDLQHELINPYDESKPNFTLDTKSFSILTQTADTYFQFDTTINLYEFFTNALKTYLIPQKAIAFKGKTEINIGLLIHRLMDRFNTVNEINAQYKASDVLVSCKELRLSDDSLVGAEIFYSLKFVAGLSLSFSEYGFLEFNMKPTRITVDGYYLLNILIPAGNYELRIFKSGNQIGTKVLPTNSTGPICEKVFFNNYKPGDQIEFKIGKIGEPDSNSKGKIFYVFPSQFYSNVIVWENEFLLQSCFEFTHEYDIKMEIDRQTSKTFNHFVEKTKHHSVSKENKLLINTGWITKSDIDSIESLIMSSRAFIKINDKIVDLVAIGKSLTNEDSKEELFDYSIEFIINRSYNEETYTF